MTADGSLGSYFEALYQITLRISSSLDLNEVLSYVSEETALSLGAKAASVRLLDAEAGTLEMAAVYGLSPEYLNKGPVQLAFSPVDRIILSGQTSQVEDVMSDPGFQYPEAAAREGIVSIASAPLIAKGRPIGVLRVYSGKPRSFTDAEMRFLQAVADLAALSIENARLYDRVRQDYEDTMNVLWGASPA